ncbi:Fe2+-enterobactin ABC transporter substrate-binding protein [Corynebacterium uropygiale]|uniref:Fe2+-enterobactin ABC transporter substrate-binding protein n=1 Tax=Corynebacterium uropygiale TaxID=1775911 RepID=A0A9X1QSG4_9CORY|nr:Fe2+-enterobactin ABC transporter substrate-binding protein [Corynebacterium uropygiale]
MRSFSTKFVAAVAAGVMAFSLAACSGDTSSSSASSGENSATEQQGQWPRTIKHELGETTLDHQPKKIANTALSATGTLLAMDAPLAATAATNPSDVTDDKGFFSQWAKVADEKGVEVLYPGLEFDLESLIAQDPDLVIVSTSGADSVSDQYQQISEKFPTIAIDYSKQSWQDLAKELGYALGLEENAEKAIKEFDEYVAEQKKKIHPAEGGASIVSYNGPGEEQGIAKLTGPHSQLLSDLGFDVKEAPEGMDTSKQARKDFSFISYENLTKGIQGDTVFLFSADEKKVEEFMKDPLLANLPAVKEHRVYPLGLTSFRLDPYSARDFVDAVVSATSAS